MESQTKCSYCKRREKESQLVRVLVYSRGKAYNSYSHPDCIPKWRMVSDIRITGNREIDLDAGLEYGVESVISPNHRDSVVKVCQKRN